jgi:hypothetical protein
VRLLRGEVQRQHLVVGHPRLACHSGVAPGECRLQGGEREGSTRLQLGGDLERALPQPLRRHDLVDQPHRQRLLRVVLAVEVPELLGALATDGVLEVPGAVPGVEAPHHRPDLPEHGVLRGQREVAQRVQDVAATHREAVDGRDDRLGHRVDQFVDVDDRQHVRVVERGHLVVLAADAEELLPRAGEHGHAQLRVAAEPAQRVGQLEGRLHPELVALLGPVDRQGDDPVGHLEQDVLVFHHASSVPARKPRPVLRPW